MAEETKLTYLETMPQSVRDWLGSDNLTFLIIDINKRLGFKDWKRSIIPQLILELATKELTPENFIAKLSGKLEISFSAARILAEEIVEKALRPIEKNLRTELGVDIVKILTAEMPPVAAPVIEKIEKEQEIGEKPLVVSEAEPLVVSPAEPPVVSEAEPFVIHEETPTFRVPVKIMPAPTKPRPTPPPIPAKAPAPTAIKPPEIPKKAPTPIKQAVRPPVGGSPPETKMLPKTTHQNSHRVVHYSNLISPLVVSRTEPL